MSARHSDVLRSTRHEEARLPNWETGLVHTATDEQTGYTRLNADTWYASSLPFA
jgi:hypothetical protein